MKAVNEPFRNRLATVRGESPFGAITSSPIDKHAVKLYRSTVYLLLFCYGKNVAEYGRRTCIPACSRLRTTLGHLKRKLRQHGGRHDLTSSQIAVVLRLEKEGPATVSSLARAEGMRPQSMSAVIAPLEEMGFVAGAADPNDGRKTLMSLTKACKKRSRTGVPLVRTGWRKRSSRNSLHKNRSRCLQPYTCLRDSLRTDRPAANRAIQTSFALSKEISCHSPSLTLKLR